MREYTNEEVEQVVELCSELLSANEELNAKIIAMDAYVKNGDSKIKLLKNYIANLELIILNYENEKTNNYNCPN